MTYDEARTTIQRYTVYRHFKGGLYQVDVIAKCEGTGKPMVIYHDMKKHGITWARPADEWYEEMDTGQKRFEEVKIVPAKKGE